MLIQAVSQALGHRASTEKLYKSLAWLGGPCDPVFTLASSWQAQGQSVYYISTVFHYSAVYLSVNLA